MKHIITIFQSWCKEGRVERYIFYLLSELRKISDYLLVVNNGEISENDLNRLSLISDDIFIRDDSGYDAGAFSDALINYLTKERITLYDELILVNDSCYGPLYSFSEMMSSMDKQTELDFWTITDQLPYVSNKHWTAQIPYHVQPYFMVIRKKMLHSNDFWEFWKELKIPDTHSQAVYNYELKLTDFFVQRGYQCGAYIDSDGLYFSENDVYPYVFHNVYKLVAAKKCPLLKRRPLKFSESLILSTDIGDEINKTISYIKDNTNYDEKLILLDMIHSMSPNDIKTALHLNYVLGADSGKSIIDKRIGVIVVVHDQKSAGYCVSRLAGMALNYEAVILTDNADVQKSIPNIEIQKYNAEDNVMKIIADLSICDKYDYVCIIDDSIKDENNLYHTVAQSYREMIWENMLKDQQYICGVISEFEKDTMLGALAPASPYFSRFFEKTPMLYSREYSKIWQILNQLGINDPNPSNKQPLTINNSFWIRTSVFRTLLQRIDEKDVKIQMCELKNWGLLVPYLVMSSDMYSGIITSESYVPILMANYQYMINELSYRIHSMEKGLPEMNDMLKMNSEVYTFCKKNRGVYIYGAGEYGHECLDYLRANSIDFLGFIVSDGYKNSVSVKENVFELSEVQLKNDEGIIIAVASDLIRILEVETAKHGILNYISFLKK